MKSFFDSCVISVLTDYQIQYKRKRVSKNVGFHSKFTFETINVSDYVKVQRSPCHSKTYQNAKSWLFNHYKETGNCPE